MAPHAIPHRQSLVSQTIAYLTAEIASGKWPGWLPSERALSEALAVSRNTLRTSLEQLKRDGIIRPVHGAGNQIVAGREKGRHQIKSRDVALLTPVPVELLRPSVALWINELRALLNEQGCRLHEFSGQQYYRSKPGPSLQKLTNLNHHGCWVLVMTPESCQRWFVRNRVPCVLGGSSYPGVDLTSVDLDHRAMCHHAAGVLLGLGHRRIAFLNRRRPWAGDVVSEEGFVDGIRSLSHGEVAPIVVHYDNSVGSFCNVMRRLMGQKSRPTALMVVNSYYYLTVASWLAQRGWRARSPRLGSPESARRRKDGWNRRARAQAWALTRRRS